MLLIELTKKAISNFEEYRNPNISEWLNAINEILTALYAVTLENRKIEKIILNEYGLTILVCKIHQFRQDDEFIILITIMNSINPLLSAKEYVLAICNLRLESSDNNSKVALFNLLLNRALPCLAPQ